MNKFIASFFSLLITGSAVAETHYVGGDISLLPEYENAGAKYKDHSGKSVPDMLKFCRQEGMNAMRVRLFVAPEKYTGTDKDPNTCQDLEYIIPLCKRIKEDGFNLLLDFHYSDTWADPAKQWTPADWAGLTDQQLYEKIYDYTKSTLKTLAENGIVPDFIQPGNEISYGMLWGPVGTPQSQLKKTYSGSADNWDRLGTLLNQAIKACREECPNAKIVIHTERVGNLGVQRNFYTWMRSLKVDYDIIGLSYYPYFHGNMIVLENALADLQKNFPEKNIMIVETGYSYKWEVPGTSQKVDYAYSDAGQNQFAKDLVATLEKYENVNGLFWWWMEYNAYGTKLSNWYNAPLFDSLTGKATSALTTICSFAGDDSGVTLLPEEINSEDPRWFNLQGVEISSPETPGIYIHNGKKVVVK